MSEYYSRLHIRVPFNFRPQPLRISFRIRQLSGSLLPTSLPLQPSAVPHQFIPRNKCRQPNSAKKNTKQFDDCVQSQYHNENGNRLLFKTPRKYKVPGTVYL